MSDISCVIHGSFRKHYSLLKDIAALFEQHHIRVLAPQFSEIIGESDGFIHLEKDTSSDPRMVEYTYLMNVLKLGPKGFSYYVNPEGNLGSTCSSELAIDQLTNTRTLFMNPLKDLPIYVPQNSVWTPEKLVQYIDVAQNYPPPIIDEGEKQIIHMLRKLQMPGVQVSVGGLVISGPDILLVKTHKWGGQYSVLGEALKSGEQITEVLSRCIYDQLGIESRIGRDICAFNEINGTRFFADKEVIVPFKDRKNIRLNTDENESYLWVPLREALCELPIECNARYTLEYYAKQT